MDKPRAFGQRRGSRCWILVLEQAEVPKKIMPTHRTIETDVCVVGSGIMGLSVAWNLAKRNIGVTCIEKSFPGSEASGATAGTLGIQNKILRAVPLVLPSVRIWETLSEELGFDVDYEKRGGFCVAHTGEEVEKLERRASSQRAAGADVELIYQPQLCKRAPYLSREIAAASFCPDDGMADPFAAVRAYLRACKSAGVAFETNQKVEGVEVYEDSTIRIRAGQLTLRCQKAVLAAGAWMPALVRPFGIEIPVATRTQQVLITDFGPSLFPHIVTHVRGNLTIKQQRITGKVLIGGGWTGDGNRDLGVKNVRLDSVTGNVEMAIRTVPKLRKTRLLRAWTGFEGRSPDRLPIMGPVGRLENIYMLGCASGGFTLAPVCGLLIAQCIAGEDPLVTWEDFTVERFLEKGAEASGRE